MDDSGLGRVVRRQAALLQLARMDLSDYASALRMLAEVDARLLGVERVSVWRFTPDHRHATCEELYTLRNKHHESGQHLDIEDSPRYFAALEEGRVIAANDAKNDPRTQELAREQRDALGITSTLDVLHLERAIRRTFRADLATLEERYAQELSGRAR